MTLIISGISKYYAFQIADRLISRAGKPFDPESNKTVLLAASDGVVALSFTGPAYIEHTPTDQWIVHTITGKPTALGFSLLPIARHERNLLANKSKIGGVLADLAVAINAAFSSATPPALQGAFPLRIVASGWQWQMKRPERFRPVMYFLGKESATAPMKCLPSPRHLGAHLCLSQMPFYVPVDQWESLQVDGPQFRNSTQWAARLQQLMISCAGRYPGYIGRALMHIDVLTPRRREVLVHYYADPNKEILAEQPRSVFTPWVVDGWHIFPPSEVVGYSELRLKDWLVRLGTDPQSTCRSILGQERKPDPLRPRRPAGPGFLP